MGTAAHIAIKNENGSVEVIYCHHDGYPSWLGRVLLETFGKDNDVRWLLAHGDAVGLDVDIEKCEFFGRDRGEEDVESIEYSNEAEWLADLEDSSIEYAYLYNGDWNVKDICVGGDFALVCDVVALEE